MSLKQIFQESRLTSAISQEMQVEEYALAAAEATNLSVEIEGLSGDLDRMVGIYLGLEDLCETVTHVGKASKTDVAFVYTAYDLAFAGVGVESESLLPSMESMVGDEISLEGIKTVAASVWESIKRALKVLWRKIKDFWRSLTSSIPGLRRSAEALKKRAEGSMGKFPENDTIELGREANSLSIMYEAPKNGTDISNGLATLEVIVEEFSDFYPKSLIKFADEAIKVINKVDAKETNVSADNSPSKALVELTNLHKQHLTFTKFADKAEIKNDGRFKNKVVKRGEPLLGNKTLFHIGPEDKNGSTTILRAAELARGSHIELTESLEKPKERVTEAEIDVISSDGAITIATTIISICNTLEKFEKSSNFNKLLDAEEKMTKATDKLNAAFIKLDKKETMPADHKSNLNSLVGFNKAFAQWVSNPQVRLAGNTVAASRAAIVAANKSLSTLK